MNEPLMYDMDFYVDQGVFSLDDFQEAARETVNFDLGTQINKEKIIINDFIF